MSAQRAKHSEQSQIHKNIGLSLTALIQQHYGIDLDHPIPPDLAARIMVEIKMYKWSSVNLVAIWVAILDAVGRASPFTRGYLIEAHPVSLVKNVFTIGFDPEFADHIDLVNNTKTRGSIQAVLADLRHPNMQVNFIKSETPRGWVETLRFWGRFSDVYDH